MALWIIAGLLVVLIVVAAIDAHAIIARLDVLIRLASKRGERDSAGSDRE